MSRLAVFRADASKVMGSGHVARCLALADELGSRGWRCELAVNAQATEIMPRLLRAPHRMQVLPAGGDAFTALRHAVHDGCDLLVVDHYNVDARHEATVRAGAGSTLVIDDLADRPHDCAYLVDQNVGRCRND